MDLSDADVDRFWSRVNKQGPVPAHRPELGNCWVWERRCSPAGYGQFWLKGRDVAAHRMTWEMENGPIPDGMLACHHCDNPKCVNPLHLFLGTHQDNMVDMHRKGRGNRVRGEAHHKAVLTAQDVICIRQRYAEGGISYERLGAEFHVTSGAIGGIISGKNWKWATNTQRGG